MNYRNRNDDTIICCSEINYNFQSICNTILFRYQNVAVKCCRNSTATTYTAGKQENGQ